MWRRGSSSRCEIEADVIVANILADILVHLTEDALSLGQG